jgi:hypothetical protein
MNHPIIWHYIVWHRYWQHHTINHTHTQRKTYLPKNHLNVILPSPSPPFKTGFPITFYMPSFFIPILHICTSIIALLISLSYQYQVTTHYGVPHYLHLYSGHVFWAVCFWTPAIYEQDLKLHDGILIQSIYFLDILFRMFWRLDCASLLR